MTLVSANDLILSDESGFACSKSKLVETGLPHLRPFNISDAGNLDLSDLYQVPADAAPRGKASLEEGDILFNNTNSAELVGKSAIIGSPMTAGFSNHMTRIRVDKARVEPAFFGYWLRRLRSTGYFTAHATQWVSQAAFKSSELRKLDLDLPPLPEQRRIVDLLSRAEGIVRLRREAEKKAAKLIPALFLDMFGDPATNPKGWPVAPIGDLVKLTNGRAFKPAEWCKEGIPIIRIQNLNDPKKPFNYYEGELPEKYKVRSGDILLSWSGTPGTSFGCFRWKRQDGWLNQHIFRVEVDHGVDEEFFIHQINLRLPELIDRAHGGVGLQHFTKGELESLPFIIPPPHAQQRFRDQAEQALSIHDQQISATAKAQATFDALLAQVFSGR